MLKVYILAPPVFCTVAVAQKFDSRNFDVLMVSVRQSNLPHQRFSFAKLYYSIWNESETESLARTSRHSEHI